MKSPKEMDTTLPRAAFSIIILCTMYVSSIENQNNFLSLLDANFTTTAQTGAVAVTDIDQDGAFDVIVAVSDAANLILGYDEGSGGHVELPLTADFREALEDKQGRTVGICACDVDGDGLDDVYLMNNNPVYPASDVIIIPDRLLSLHGAGGVRDLFSLPGNAETAPARGGNAVGCIDSDSDGRYEIFLATYSKDGRGIIQRIHVDNEDIVKVENLEVISADSDKYLPQRVARGFLVGPLLSGTGSDVFVTCDTSNHVGSSVTRHQGDNLFLRNNGDGIFTDIAATYGMDDRDADSYGAFLGDLDSDGDLDLVYVNWLGQARLFMGFNHTGFTQHPFMQRGAGTASMVLLFGDFDTTGHPSILVTDVAAPDNYRPGNQIFHVSVQGNSTLLDNYSLGELLGSLYMNGVGKADLNHDGNQEILVSHNIADGRTFSIFQSEDKKQDWISFMPLTRNGGYARGASVKLTLSDRSRRSQVIGGDCSYMCQSEPVAHFGIGNNIPLEVFVRWADGHTARYFLHKRDIGRRIIVSYNGALRYTTKHRQTSVTNVVSQANGGHDGMESTVRNIFISPFLFVYMHL